MELSPDKHRGSVIGSTLLITGSCIGAGMLGLPANSALAGFIPSLFLFVATWLFMMTTGLLLLEVNLSFKEEVNIITMAGRTLGAGGKAVVWGLFLFLFYSLMVAFISGSGELLGDFAEESMGLQLSNAAGSLLCTALFGAFIYFGAYAVDHFNRLLVVGMAATYLLLLLFAFPHIEPSRLTHLNLGETLWVAPIMVISFGYHNLIPSLTNYLKGDSRGMRKAIIYGSFLPLIAYILWECVILGLIPHEQFFGGNGEHIVTHVLKTTTHSSQIIIVTQYFAFFAIATTLLGVGLSLVDFLADGFSIKKTARGRGLLCALALIPPLCFSLFYPNLFVAALKYAGGFGAVLLFGVVPALMVWSGRYRAKEPWSHRLVGGGKPMLACVILFALAIFAIQLVNTLYYNK